MSRRRVASDAKNRVPEWPWTISKLVQDRSADAATIGFQDVAMSTACCCRNGKDRMNDKMRQTREEEER